MTTNNVVIPRRVVCAVIRDANGQMVCGPRHFDHTMHSQVNGMMVYTLPWEQGFIDQHGVFMDRVEALRVATEAGQVLCKTGPSNLLFSEDIY